jgi:L,D-transpeptidase ErfK/SrfK
MNLMKRLISLISILGAMSGPLAMADSYTLRQGDRVIGTVGAMRAEYEDTLADIGRRFGVGYDEIVRANPDVDPWLPGSGTEILLPTRFVLPHGVSKGLVINIAEYRMYYFRTDAEGSEVITFPISIGRQDWATPLGEARVVSKLRKPSWYPPQSVRDEHAAEGKVLDRVVPPGPENPLGEYAMRLNLPGYLIHGTNRPAGVGMRVTHGCIRMFPEDIEWLFPQVAVDTAVRIVNEPYKLDWLENELYLEVHPPLEEDAELVERDLTPITELYVRITRDRPADIDWALVEQVFRERNGVAVRVGEAILESDADSVSESEKIAAVAED